MTDKANKTRFPRRTAIFMTAMAAGGGLAALSLPRGQTSVAIKDAPSLDALGPPRELTWEELVPPGVPYAEIIGEGFLDEQRDIWRPLYDANATKLNQFLDGAYIKMPGFVVPLDFDATHVTKFVLVPYAGACVHTPPPPANQLVYTESRMPWPTDKLMDAVWVTGTIRTELQTTEVADTGYSLIADKIEVYIW